LSPCPFNNNQSSLVFNAIPRPKSGAERQLTTGALSMGHSLGHEHGRLRDGRWVGRNGCGQPTVQSASRLGATAAMATIAWPPPANLAAARSTFGRIGHRRGHGQPEATAALTKRWCQDGSGPAAAADGDRLAASRRRRSVSVTIRCGHEHQESQRQLPGPIGWDAQRVPDGH
jgi:hypothetical protein